MKTISGFRRLAGCLKFWKVCIFIRCEFAVINLLLGAPPDQVQQVRAIFEDIGIFDLESIKEFADDRLSEKALIEEKVKLAVARRLVKAIAQL